MQTWVWRLDGVQEVSSAETLARQKAKASAAAKAIPHPITAIATGS